MASRMPGHPSLKLPCTTTIFASQRSHLKQGSGGLEFGSFCLAGHLRVDGFLDVLSEGTDGRTPVHAAALYTLSTLLNPLDASGRLSRLMAVSSRGAFIAPQMARRFRSARLSVSSAIQSVSRAAPRRRSISRCWLRASVVESAGRVNAAMRGFTMAGTGNSASVKGLRSRRSSMTRPSRIPYPLLALMPATHFQGYSPWWSVTLDAHLRPT